jgi:hypothetical protein
MDSYIPVIPTETDYELVSLTQFESQLQTQKDAILNALEYQTLDIDATMATGVKPTTNTNGLQYFVVTAQQVDEEMQVTVRDRAGVVLASTLSPFNTTAVVLCCSVESRGAMEFGFNADVQDYYDVRPNGRLERFVVNPGSGAANLSIMLEITKTTGNDEEVILGEVFYGVQVDSWLSSPPIVVMVNPIPQ